MVSIARIVGLTFSLLAVASPALAADTAGPTRNVHIIGASGIIGVSAAARAAPDGYTLLIGTLSTHALVPQAGAAVPSDLSAWIGLLAPAGTPEPVVARINAEVTRILRSLETRAWADRHGLEIIGGSPASFATTMAADYQRWGEIIQRLQLRPE